MKFLETRFLEISEKTLDIISNHPEFKEICGSCFCFCEWCRSLINSQILDDKLYFEKNNCFKTKQPKFGYFLV
jgi:hypothetical protein